MTAHVRTLFVCLLLGTLAPVSCALLPKVARDEPPPAPSSDSAPEMLRIAPPARAAGLYAVPDARPAKLEVPASELRALIEEEARRLAVPVPALDARLCRAAETMTAGTRGLLFPPARLTSFALAREGVVQTDAYLLVGRLADKTADRKELRELIGRALKDRFQSVGIGTRRELVLFDVFVIVMQRALAQVEPFPRNLASGAGTTIRLRLIEPAHDAVAYVTGLDGMVSKPALHRADDGALELRVACGRTPGVMQVEVMATTARGPAIAINVPIACGQEPSDEIVLPRPGAERFPGSVEEAEREIFELLNRDRTKAGLQPLRPHQRAAAMARQHADDMAQNQFVGHVSPTRGSTDERMRAAGILTQWVLENVASSVSPSEGHAGLMESPSHRSAILSAQATHVGIGVALGPLSLGGQAVYVTEVFLPDAPDGGAASGGFSYGVANDGAAAGQTIRRVYEGADTQGCRIRGLRSIDVAAGWRHDSARRAQVDAEIDQAARKMTADTALLEEGDREVSATFFACGAKRPIAIPE